MKKLRHIGIVVKDLEKSYQFYSKNFGFKIKTKMLEEGAFISNILAKKNVRVETLKMEPPSQDFCLELLSFSHPSLIPDTGNVINRQGLTHFAVTVENIEKLYTQLNDEKIKFLSPPTISANKAVKVAFFQGFDGELIELVEELEPVNV